MITMHYLYKVPKISQTQVYALWIAMNKFHAPPV